MQLLPTDVPAELHLRAIDGASERIVARGPLIAMAQGLMSLETADRDRCWITCEAGDLSPEDAAQALRLWSQQPPLANSQ